MSRKSRPKQFIDILGTGETLIQRTFRRFLKVFPQENIFIVTNEIYQDLVREQIHGISPDRILCEPARRNTAPCIAYAIFRIHELDPEANIVVAPSDHIITMEDVFAEVITAALSCTASSDRLLTLGIRPSRPDTGYGYIQFDDSVTCPSDSRIKKVKTFTEKPALEMAVSFIESGEFLWNSGIFIWSLKSIMAAFDKYLPEISSLFREGTGIFNTPEEAAFVKNTYAVCKSISIDYGIMEKAENVFVLSSDFGWSDLGTWGSLYDNRDKDNNGNTVVGKNVLIYDSKDCIVNMPKEKLVVLQGLEDYIVVEDENILLVCRKSEEQQIRQFVSDVKIQKGEQFV